MEDISHSPMSLESAVQPREQGAASRSSRHIDRRSLSGREENRIAQLVRTIECEVVPRMLLAHRSNIKGPRPAQQERGLSDSEVEELSRLVLAHDSTVALSYVDAIRTEGTHLDSILLDLMAPAARHLGVLWSEDLCDFTDVTIGLVRLHQVLRHLSVINGDDLVSGADNHCVLLLPVPDEQHCFGMVMVAEFFRRAGWGVREEYSCTKADLADIVSSEHFDLVGFSLSCDNRLDALSACIRLVRRASYNKRIANMVGGRVFIEQPDLVAKVGADATAVDGKRAVQQAQQLLGLIAERPH